MKRNRYALYGGKRRDSEDKAIDNTLERIARERREAKEKERAELLRPRRWIDYANKHDN